MALELERQDRIRRYGEPVLAASLCGWWSPDKGDMHHIHALLYYERYEYQAPDRPQLCDCPSWLLHSEDSRFRWLNEFPPPSPDLATATATAGHVNPEDLMPDVLMTPEASTGDDDTDVLTATPNGFTDEDMDGATLVWAPSHELDVKEVGQHAHSA
ncbi:hypothetical protein ARMGADRAFT_1090110 [Armillaria gallica]|uniref:Uncharacterized protein n=1 Tax=Armillaria gallica TaxID=47427 RepID=A0A2H3CW28_ARMGA|nr:hypothetical protein ARMGADRAFT_1090110 [Armillaria gallica]